METTCLFWRQEERGTSLHCISQELWSNRISCRPEYHVNKPFLGQSTSLIIMSFILHKRTVWRQRINVCIIGNRQMRVRTKYTVDCNDSAFDSTPRDGSTALWWEKTAQLWKIVEQGTRNVKGQSDWAEETPKSLLGGHLRLGVQRMYRDAANVSDRSCSSASQVSPPYTRGPEYSKPLYWNEY